MSVLTDTRRLNKSRRQIEKLERQLVSLNNIYQYVRTHPNFDLRKSIPKQVRQEIGDIQITLYGYLELAKAQYLVDEQALKDLIESEETTNV